MASGHFALPSVQESAEVAIPLPAEVVWDFCWRAENGPLVSEAVLEGFTVPGSPSGEVGEIQCHIQRADGGLLVGVLTEVIELDSGRRVVTRSLSTKEAMLSSTEVVPAGPQACVLRVSHGMTLTGGKHRKIQDALRDHVLTYVSRVAEVLAALYPNGAPNTDGSETEGDSPTPAGS